MTTVLSHVLSHLQMRDLTGTSPPSGCKVGDYLSALPRTW